MSSNPNDPTTQMIGPISGLTIGSPFPRETATLKETALDVNSLILTANDEAQTLCMVHGVSSYNFGETMNQGSCAMNLSSGFLGIGSLNVAASAYYSTDKSSSTANASLSFTMLCRRQIVGINHANQTISDIYASLYDGPKERLDDVQEKMSALLEALRANSGKIGQMTYGDLQSTKEFKQWFESARAFRASFGEFFVHKVVLGGIGSVTLELRNDGQASRHQYGGSLGCSWSDPFGTTSASIGASFGHDDKSASRVLKFVITASSAGDCVTAAVNEWLKQFNSKADAATSELLKLGIQDGKDLFPKNDIPKVQLPLPPAPQKSSASSNGKDEQKNASVARIDKGDLNAIAVAAGLNEVSPTQSATIEKDTPLDRITASSVRSETITTLQTMIRTQQISTTTSIASQISSTRSPATAQASVGPRPTGFLANAAPPSGAVMQEVSVASSSEGSSSAYDMSANGNFVPLGVSVLRWADLFPWLEIERPYGLASILEAEAAIRYHIMQQDMLALARMYEAAADARIEGLFVAQFKIGDATFTFETCANSFYSVSDMMRSKAPQKGSFAELLSDAFKALGGDTLIKYLDGRSKDFNSLPIVAKIYLKWNEIKVLRNCELGLGLVQMKVQEDIKLGETWDYSLYPCNFDVVDGSQLRGLGISDLFIVPWKWSVPVLKRKDRESQPPNVYRIDPGVNSVKNGTAFHWDGGWTYTMLAAQLSVPEDANQTLETWRDFHEGPALLPLVLPDGTIHVFNHESGVLCERPRFDKLRSFRHDRVSDLHPWRDMEISAMKGALWDRLRFIGQGTNATGSEFGYWCFVNESPDHYVASGTFITAVPLAFSVEGCRLMAKDGYDVDGVHYFEVLAYPIPAKEALQDLGDGEQWTGLGFSFNIRSSSIGRQIEAMLDRSSILDDDKRSSWDAYCSDPGKWGKTYLCNLGAPSRYVGLWPDPDATAGS